MGEREEGGVNSGSTHVNDWPPTTIEYTKGPLPCPAPLKHVADVPEASTEQDEAEKRAGLEAGPYVSESMGDCPEVTPAAYENPR